MVVVTGDPRVAWKAVDSAAKWAYVSVCCWAGLKGEKLVVTMVDCTAASRVGTTAA